MAGINIFIPVESVLLLIQDEYHKKKALLFIVDGLAATL